MVTLLITLAIGAAVTFFWVRWLERQLRRIDRQRAQEEHEEYVRQMEHDDYFWERPWPEED